MIRFLPPDSSCSNCVEVVQICMTDGRIVTKCQQIPVSNFIDVSSPTLAEMAPTLLACFSLMSIAWVFKLIVNHILLR